MFADVSLGDLLWTMLWFFFLMIWIMILIQILSDLFRDHETSGVAKAAWVIALVLFTPITVLIYLIARGSGMAKRNLEAQAAAQKQFDEYVRATAGSGGGSSVDEIARAKQLLDGGAITQAEFDAIKAKAIAG